MIRSDSQLARTGRAAGIMALVLAAVFIASIFAGPGNVLHGETSAAKALSYSAQNGHALVVLGFLDGLINTLFGILIVLLVAVSGSNGILARIAYISVAAAAAIQWTHAGMLYALAELAQRGGADGGVLALFTLGSTMDESDGVVIPVAMTCAGILLLWSGRVPRILGWLAIAAATVGVVPTLVKVAGGPDMGPVSVISAWVWLLGSGIILLVKPITNPVPAVNSELAASG